MMKNWIKKDFLEKMKASKNPVRTSCPSPFEFKEKILEMEEDQLIILTISKQLSGTYNAAKVGLEAAQKENPNKKNPHIGFSFSISRRS